MQESDGSRIERVYFTTSSENRAMKRHTESCGFTGILNGNQHWDTDFVWNIPFVPTYTQGADKFPTHIRASMAPDTFIPNAFFCSKDNVLDRTLWPTDAETSQHLASIGTSPRKMSRCETNDQTPDKKTPDKKTPDKKTPDKKTPSDKTADDKTSDDKPTGQYHFHSFYNPDNPHHKNEMESDEEVPETP